MFDNISFQRLARKIIIFPYFDELLLGSFIAIKANIYRRGKNKRPFYLYNIPNERKIKNEKTKL